MHHASRARAAAAAALVAVIVAVVALASQRHATPLLLHALPQPQPSLITVAVAILPPSPTFSPQPFPLEAGIHPPIPRLREQAAVAAWTYAMPRERADFSPVPRGSPFREPPPRGRHWEDFSSLDSAHAGRLCARTGLHNGQQCIYCHGRGGATCILWACGGGAACFDCTDKARSGGLEALDRVRADRWLQSLSLSKTGKWRDEIASGVVGHVLAPYVIHLHQNRGNVWLRQVGWTNLYPSRDPAPEWGAAVAASQFQGGPAWRRGAALWKPETLCDIEVSLEDGVHRVCQVVEAATAIAWAAVTNLPPQVDIRLYGGPAAWHLGTLSRKGVQDGMSCRLLLLDCAGVHAAADRSGALIADRHEANRIRFCTMAVAGAVERLETEEPPSRVRAAYGARPSPVPGDIRTFELNVQIVLEQVDRVRNAEQVSRLQMRIRELAMLWATSHDRDQESALLDGIHTADAALQRLLGVEAWPLAAIQRSNPTLRQQSRRRERAVAEGGQAADAEALRQRAFQSEREAQRADDAAVAAFEALREREVQMERAETVSSSTSPVIRNRRRGRAIRERGRGRDSSEDGS